MKKHSFILASLAFLFLLSCLNKPKPLSLHPQNSHYFLFRDKPTILIGSTEHYGAVINPDFDYIKYLDELQSRGLNVTRTFSGIYLEPMGAFGINENTMAPKNGKLICPWARSEQPGYAGGGNKFDLTKWDNAYFERLKNFIGEAGKRNIVVELDLFSNFYDTIQWKLSPVNAANNINALAPIIDHKEILSLKHPEILAIQEKMVRKIVSELKNFDNLYYEICNEPYFGDLKALEAWEEYMTGIVADAQKNYSDKHLISQNIGNGFQKIDSLNKDVSIFNFHYAKPPLAVEMNYNLNRVIGDNETGFNGIEDVHYRTEAWDFLVAGGGLFNNLDYSFSVGHEDGSLPVVAGQPGGGGANLRNQFQILKRVFDQLDFISMKPANQLLKNKLKGNATTRILAKDGEQYLIYINNTLKESANYSLRYKGFLTVPVSGKYWLYTVSDDGVRLFLDNKQIITNWNSHSSTTDSASIELVTGKKYQFTLEYYQGNGGAVLNFNWRIPGANITAVPISAFSANDSKTPGLNVIKYNGIDLLDKADEAIVTQINAVGIIVPDNDSEKWFEISIDLPKGNYMGEWIDPVSGERKAFIINAHPGGTKTMITPVFNEDIALLIKK